MQGRHWKQTRQVEAEGGFDLSQLWLLPLLLLAHVLALFAAHADKLKAMRPRIKSLPEAWRDHIPTLLICEWHIRSLTASGVEILLSGQELDLRDLVLMEEMPADLQLPDPHIGLGGPPPGRGRGPLPCRSGEFHPTPGPRLLSASLRLRPNTFSPWTSIRRNRRIFLHPDPAEPVVVVVVVVVVVAHPLSPHVPDPASAPRPGSIKFRKIKVEPAHSHRPCRADMSRRSPKGVGGSAAKAGARTSAHVRCDRIRRKRANPPTHCQPTQFFHLRKSNFMFSGTLAVTCSASCGRSSAAHFWLLILPRHEADEAKGRDLGGHLRSDRALLFRMFLDARAHGLREPRPAARRCHPPCAAARPPARAAARPHDHAVRRRHRPAHSLRSDHRSACPSRANFGHRDLGRRRHLVGAGRRPLSALAPCRPKDRSWCCAATTTTSAAMSPW